MKETILIMNTVLDIGLLNSVQWYPWWLSGDLFKDLLPATNFTCYWSEPRGAHYCHYKFPRTNLYAEDVKLRGCEPGVAGRCWPDIDVYVSQTLSSHQGGEIMLPFNLPVATLQFVIMAKSFTKLSPPSQPSTINISGTKYTYTPSQIISKNYYPNSPK